MTINYNLHNGSLSLSTEMYEYYCGFRNVVLHYGFTPADICPYLTVAPMLKPQNPLQKTPLMILMYERSLPDD